MTSRKLDPHHPECPHGVPQGWTQIVDGDVQANLMVWDALVGWTTPNFEIGKPVKLFGTVIIKKEWGPTPHPGDKYSFGGREMLFVDTANDYATNNKFFIWFELDTQLGWLIMTREDFYEPTGGPLPELVSSGHDVPKYPGTRSPTASAL